MKNRFNFIAFILLTATSGWPTKIIANQTEVKLRQVTEKCLPATYFVGTLPPGGKVQLELLLCEGLTKNDRVLEIGCGALTAGIPIMSFLNIGHYVGIDPNKWLIDSTLEVKENWEVAIEKQPLFLYNSDFDASNLNTPFDYIISHSIISHAAHWQLSLFMENCSKVLKKNGKVVFSVRLTEPNEYGNPGAPQETRANEWQYPGVSFFHKETIAKEALKHFSLVEHKKEYTKLITADDPNGYHDWFVLTK